MSSTAWAVLAVAAALAIAGIIATIRVVRADAPRPVRFDPRYDSRQPTLRR
ncbi:hypothetical protein [Gryllotalpicola sp.]|uniref:hypothetical protein n=1 Tax=Gryllotalpicola sp. TaxID=1932787 RepID=UPI00260B5FE1|nr:hypothetical protein [Gryllotalpicola sp.]